MGRGLPKKGGEGAWTVCRVRGGGAWQKKRGGIFEGGGWGLIPQCTLWFLGLNVAQ